MKRNLQIAVAILFVVVGVISINKVLTIQEKKSIELAKTKHKEFLENSPFKNKENLTKKERFQNGLPPNKYYERLWELTMNPEIGRPTPENLDQIRNEIQEQWQLDIANGRVPGDATDNNWIERGPNNVGGRTRALMFDPNDSTNETVFAGGVSGGLWKNTNISNAASSWTQIDFPEHVNVTKIVADPNDSNVFYIGTGESWVTGQVNGNGVWKSTDGGNTWANVFGGATGEASFLTDSKVVVNSPAVISGEYAAIDSNYGGTQLTVPVTGNLVLVDDGSANPTEGCNPIVNSAEVNGNIAVIVRGSCNFTAKVINAQNAGAIAVVMVNNIGGPPITMGGTGSPSIPAVMVSKADGDAMIAQLGSGVNVTLEPVSNASEWVGFFVVPGNMHINDIAIKDNGGVSEIYLAAGSTFYSESSPVALLGPDSYGVYKSTDGGSSWSLSSVPTTTDGNNHEPNNIEIAIDGTIWMSTRNSPLHGDGGGKVFSSADGDTFGLVYEVTDGERTEIATSKTNAGTVYVLAELSTGGVTMKRTNTSFVPLFTVVDLPLPNDADPNIAANDFPNNQAFYNLVIELEPTNDQNVFVGGIDLFKSTNGGGFWNQLSHWYGGFGIQYAHADQHAVAFGNGDVSKVVFGNDGGVYYSADGGTTIQERNNGYNTSQFYTVGVAPTTAFTGDYFAGGLQDNGTQLFENANPTGTDSSSEPYGGDGAYTFFDQDGTDKYFIRNYVYSAGINLYNFDTSSEVVINSESLAVANGDFINQQDLDSNLNILYTNYSSDPNFIIRRYSGILSSGTLTKTSLTNALLDASPTAFKVSPFTTTSSTLLVGLDSGKLLKLENADTTPAWSELDTPFFGSVSDIEFGQSENDIFVTMHNYGVESIYYSADGGVTWESKEGNLPDLPVKTILQNPLNLEQVIVGTDLGVWFTEDFSSANPNWSPAFNGMSNTMVTDLDLRDDNMVFAATYGRGIFSGTFTPDALSVDENILSEGINVYPTISNGSINIESKLSLGDVKLNIYSLNGQKVHSSNLELSANNTQRINLNLSSGMYIAQFVTETNETDSRKIIIE